LDGWLYDCDFNQMLDLSSIKSKHISSFNEGINFEILFLSTVMVVAGAGSSCQGVVA
jgi:hypothetical protein